jgi:hypothetical protein
MKKSQKIVIGMMGILALCILFLWNIRTIINLFYISPPQPPSIENIQSATPINFDVVTDQVGNIHLVWASEGETPTYQKSTNQGKTWLSIMSFDDLRFVTGLQIHIISAGDRLILLWTNGGCLFRRISSDDGNSWSEPQRVISKDSQYVLSKDNNPNNSSNAEGMVKTPSQISSVLVSDTTICILFETLNDLGTYFTRSESYGFQWSRPMKLFPNNFCRDKTPVATAAAASGNIHIIYQNSEPIDSASAGLCYLRSTDLGENWNNRNIHCLPIDDSEHDAEGEKIVLKLIGLPRLAVNGFNLHLIFADDDFSYMSSDDNGQHWSKPFSIATENFAEYSLFADNSWQVFIPYISYENSEKDWWGYFPEPLPDLIGIDRAGPEWSNNDLYYTLITDSILVKANRLTHQLSYAQRVDENGSHSIKCIQSGKNPMIFWAGKKKVGKSLGDSAYEIFYKTLNE